MSPRTSGQERVILRWTVPVASVPSYYAILFNAADVKDATQYLAETPTVVSGQFSSSGLLTASLGPQTGKEWAAVPEPTSGLLLLLGVAGLALRRRRA